MNNTHFLPDTRHPQPRTSFFDRKYVGCRLVSMFGPEVMRPTGNTSLLV